MTAVQPVSTVDYAIKDTAGALQAIHRRRVYTDRPKDYIWLKPDGTVGLGGILSSRLPLYRAETIGVAPQVILVEGEHAADALAAFVGEKVLERLAVVGTVTGAAGTPDTSALEVISRLQVILWPDGDAAGRKHMERISDLLRFAASVRMVEWTGAPAKGDAVDWIAAGHTLDDLRALTKAAPVVSKPWSAAPATLETGRPYFGDVPAMVQSTTGRTNQVVTALVGKVHRASDVTLEAKPIDWIWDTNVALGAITEVVGKPKTSGKTTLLHHLIRALLQGLPFLDLATTRVPVLYLTEEGATTFERRLAHLALRDVAGFRWLSKREAGLARWEDFVDAARVLAQDKEGAGLIVVDTLGKLAGFKDEDEQSSGKAMAALAPLQRLVSDLHVAVMVGRHAGYTRQQVGEAGRGSSALTGEVDQSLLLKRPGGDGHDRERILEAIGRLSEEAPEPLRIILEEGQYRVVQPGDAMRKARQAILEIWPDEPTPIGDCLAELDSLGVKSRMAYSAANELVGEGSLVESREVPEGGGRPRKVLSRPGDKVSAASEGQKQGAENNSDRVSAPHFKPAAETSELFSAAPIYTLRKDVTEREERDPKPVSFSSVASEIRQAGADKLWAGMSPAQAIESMAASKPGGGV